MKKLSVQNKKCGVVYVLVDDEDAEILNDYYIYYNQFTRYFVCVSKLDKSVPPIPLHRLIAKVPEGLVGDHINGNTHDCRRENLQPIHQAGNTRKRRKHKTYGGKPTSSTYKGVSWSPHHQQWYAYIRINGVLLNLGYYDDPRLAAAVYDYFASQLFREFANLNNVKVRKNEFPQAEIKKRKKYALKNLRKYGRFDDADNL